MDSFSDVIERYGLPYSDTVPTVDGSGFWAGLPWCGPAAFRDADGCLGIGLPVVMHRTQLVHPWAQDARPTLLTFRQWPVPRGKGHLILVAHLYPGRAGGEVGFLAPVCDLGQVAQVVRALLAGQEVSDESAELRYTARLMAPAALAELAVQAGEPLQLRA